jgi:hypothetical protein
MFYLNAKRYIKPFSDHPESTIEFDKNQNESKSKPAVDINKYCAAEIKRVY